MRGASQNFGFLDGYDERLEPLAAQAELYFHQDPNLCLIRVRQFGEVLAQEVAAHAGLYGDPDEKQVDLLRRLRDRGVLTREVADLFRAIRKAGNRAVHDLVGAQSDALSALKFAWRIGTWFHQTFGAPKFRAGPFKPPEPPPDATDALKGQVEALKRELADGGSEADKARLAAEEAERARMSAEERSRALQADLEAAEALMAEAELKQAAMLERLQKLQARAIAEPQVVQQVAERAQRAGNRMALDEADTRRLIDSKLREAGWEADSFALTWSEGVRPQKGKNLAIAEVPTASGPADYVLFIGFEAVGVVEAKRSARDVASSIEQSKRYSRAFEFPGEAAPAGGPWGDYRVPFLFATNGRPYLKQLATKSGTWFLDARRPENTSRALDGWKSPEGLKALLQQDVDEAHAKLEKEPTEYLGLRDYQLEAIAAVEDALREERREVLLAMATGVGKTRTCIGLCYRLLKAKRFRRILFLVDRSALGEQAGNAFKDARLENLQTFTDIYDVKELGDIEPDPDTKLQVATVQAMVRRILYQDGDLPPVDAYDCIVIDECHRGYNLDREMSDAELTFRSEADYISKYRRVLEHFDAVKVGLTATPAMHTAEIFGEPVYTYSYRQAVIDGWLVDHEPPVRITTALAEDGIHWQVGEEVETYSPSTGEIQMALLPDEVHVEIDEFNRKVLTTGFNRAVCEFLAKHIDPSLDGKTLIFCATDAHADTVVHLLKEAFAEQYGAVPDNAVVKITGAADKPLHLIRRYKNERLPNVAVTVDLLTTGIDVPEITNIVFLRRVRSRILYEQMLGRATRRCDAIGKAAFMVYDAVDLYSALAPYTDMKPVVTNPQITFAQLAREITTVDDEAFAKQALEQFATKLGRKVQRLRRDQDRTRPGTPEREAADEALERLETAAGRAPDELLEELRSGDVAAAKELLQEPPSFGSLLDNLRGVPGEMLISHHDDEIRSVERGYGDADEPEDYLESFEQYLKEHLNDIPALLVVTQRPRELTRAQLKELKLALDQAGYSETVLRAAWRDATNQDIAASIIGHIRRAALGDPLVPYDKRVARALERIMSSRPWTAPQRKWLERIGKQLVQETVVDVEALDRGQFKAQGGFKRMNKVFDGKLEQILGDISEAVWEQEDAG